MNLLAIVGSLCNITARQSELLQELVTELEHINQVSDEVKEYYRGRYEELEKEMGATSYRSGNIPGA